MDAASFIRQWKGREVVAFCGPVKYRGMLADVLEDGFLVMTNVAIINAAANESSEYIDCVLNVSEISGLAYREVVGRGAEGSESY